MINLVGREGTEERKEGQGVMGKVRVKRVREGRGCGRRRKVGIWGVGDKVLSKTKVRAEADLRGELRRKREEE